MLTPKNSSERQARGARVWPWGVGLLVVLALFGGLGRLIGDEPQKSSEQAALPDSLKGLETSFIDTTDVLVSLGAVIALIFFLAFVVRKFTGIQGVGFRKGSHLRVVETVSLGPRRHLSLVTFHDRVLVIGSQETGSLVTLTEIQDQALVDSLSQPKDEDRSFASHLLTEGERRGGLRLASSASGARP